MSFYVKVGSILHNKWIALCLYIGALCLYSGAFFFKIHEYAIDQSHKNNKN